MRMCLAVTAVAVFAQFGPAPPARATSFVTETIDPAGGSKVDLALDSQGQPHVAYRTPDGKLRYASRGAAGWTLDTYANGGLQVSDPSLALDASDHPVVAFWSIGDPLCMRRLRYVTDTGSGWAATDVRCAMGDATGVVLDAAGQPHFLYFVGTDGWSHYAGPLGAAWSDEWVISGGDPYTDMELRLDASGRPRAVGEGMYNTRVVYAFKDAGAWARETIETTPFERHFISLALDAAGVPSIAYMDPLSNAVKFATRGASGWTVSAVPGATPGSYTSLELDSQGGPRIAFSDGQLRYLSKGVSGWTNEVVANGGTYASLELDANDAPRIAYVGDHGVQYSRAVQAGLAFAPATLNLRRQAPWITVYLESSDFDLAALDVSSLRIGSVAPEAKFATLGDADADGVPDLMLKFASSSLTPMLHEGANPVVLTGRLRTGDEVAVGGSIQVIDPGPAASMSLRIVSRSGMAPVSYVVSGTGRAAQVRVFDVQGRLIRSWRDVPFETVRTWDGTREDGARVGSGLYFVRAEAGGQSAVRRVVVRR